MSRLRATLREHSHFIIIITLLTLVVTFPTIIYVFRTDDFWLPGGAHPDSFIKFWDVWYGEKLLTGRADRFHTDLMYYPEGVSLINHPFFIPYIIVANVVSAFLPLSNAVSLVHLLIVISSALSAYIYILWLFKDKWTALLGSVVFGLSPHVIHHTFHPDTAWIAPIPLVLYFFHRGVREDRLSLVVASGLITGLTSTVILYTFVTVLILLGFFVCAFAVTRWRDKRYWLSILLLLLVVAVSSAWRVYPLISDTESLGSTMAWHGTNEVRTDAISYVVNHENPFLGRIVGSLVQSPSGPHISRTSYLGYVPLLLICVSLISKAARRQMLPWAFLCALFLILRLGSRLRINGTVYPDILLPKYYLDQIPPGIFEAFWEVDMFMMGAVFPFTVLTCFGLVAIQKQFPVSAKPTIVLALIVIIAVEYYVPIQGRVIPDQEIAFLDWLAQENGSDEIRLINLPMGRGKSKIYMMYQALSGYPHAEGAISRTPDRAYDYIRANYLLNAWYRQRPIHCEMADRDAYLAGLALLDEDGFSHVVYHRRFQNSADISYSFDIVEPSYRDDFVSIYRLSDLRDSCPAAASLRQRFTQVYADALQTHSTLDERRGTVIVIPPTPEAGHHFLRHLQYYNEVDHTVITIVRDEAGNISAPNSKLPGTDLLIDLEHYAAVWLLNDSIEFKAENAPVFQNWFTKRFQFCGRYHDEERVTIDLYLRLDIPCSVIDQTSALEVGYGDGVRLRSASYDISDTTLRFYLAWTDAKTGAYSFSLQLFDENGNKAYQYDSVIYRQLLTVAEMDTASLSAGVYTVKLIVYDFETKKSQGGIRLASGESFERELEIARIPYQP